MYLLVLYNCGMIFFILSFFLGYILSFGLVRLRTIRLSARAGAHIECSYRNKESRQCFGIPMRVNVLHIRIFV